MIEEIEMLYSKIYEELLTACIHQKNLLDRIKKECPDQKVNKIINDYKSDWVKSIIIKASNTKKII